MNIAISDKDAGKPTFVFSFEALVSIEFGSQIDIGVQVEYDSGSKSFTLAGKYTERDLKPLKTFDLPDEVQNALTIHASKASPAEFMLSVSEGKKLSVRALSRFTVDIENLGPLSGSIEASGTISPGSPFDGYFVGKLDQLPTFTADVSFERGQWYLSNESASCSHTRVSHCLMYTTDYISRQLALTASNSNRTTAAFLEASAVPSCSKIEEFTGNAGAPFFRQVPRVMGIMKTDCTKPFVTVSIPGCYT